MKVPMSQRTITILRRIDELEREELTASIAEVERNINRIFGLNKTDLLNEIAIRIETPKRFEAFKSSTKPVDAQLRIWLDMILRLQEIVQRLTETCNA